VVDVTLEGKSVVITSGAAGIGRYIALGCAERGANVTLGDIDVPTLERTGAELRALGGGVATHRCDVREEDQVAEMMSAAAERFGGIDYLVNSAGIAPQFAWKPLWPYVRDTEGAFWETIFATNLTGVFLCCKAALAQMVPQRSGHIVNVISRQSGVTGLDGVAYIMSKQAIAVFSRYLAEQEREHGICVMAIGPGGPYATETASPEARASLPGPELSGDRYFLAADAPMELSGRVLDLVDGELVPLDVALDHEVLPLGAPTELARRR
jgi:NAD(P)-dependent dehydrogenase (short-subunit alcohol dehydrogenase family)